MSIELRPYQAEARDAILHEWAEGRKRTLLVLPTGCGKTVCFASVVKEQVKDGARALIMAHRGELLDQAADKVKLVTGLDCAYEKAGESSLGSWMPVTVGSVQSLCQEKRLQQFPKDYFATIVVDEAHHCLSDSYQRVLEHFKDANVLGVTATPDRGDMRNLGRYFDSRAYEYTMSQAIREKYLCPIKAQMIPLKLDISDVGMSNGDYNAGEIGMALEPYLRQIAHEIAENYADRKTVVFLPLVHISQTFCDLLNEMGVPAAEVNGNSADRADILRDFENGRYSVLCNSMLLTEGWDCPAVDCIVILRPTKVRSLYCLDEKTEILTPSGWKKDVALGELVAAFDKATDEIKYVPAIAKVRRPLEADEYFCSIKGPSTDIRVTNQHRMLYDNRKKTGWKIKTAEELASLHDGMYIPVSGKGNFKGVPLSDDELRFIGWVMTDGSINKANGAITISQSEKQPWIEEIQKCIEGCGFKYRRFICNSKTSFKRNGDNVCWTISKGKPRGTDKDKRGWSALQPYLSKEISPLLSDMTERQFDVMLEAINLGDGHKHKGKGWTQHSFHIRKGNRTFIERLQQMAIQRGYRASFTSEIDQRKRPIWCVHLKKQSFVCVGSTYDGRPQWTREKHTEENCWCVENELGTLVTRRNGKVAIVGNCQMVGRGMRLYPGKKELILLDFLWMTERHDLCRPSSLISKDEKIAARIDKQVMDAPFGVDIMEAEEEAEKDVLQEREQALARQLAEMRNRQRKQVDPLQYAMSIAAEDLANYSPTFTWEMAPPSQKQLQFLEKHGIFAESVENMGKARLLIDRLIRRQDEGLSTPKQIRCLERYGFRHVGTWTFEQAGAMISRLADNHWHIPFGLNVSAYRP